MHLSAIALDFSKETLSISPLNPCSCFLKSLSNS
nr:MAG TPA: hypothetical protein [Caudoviricetes sp.]DAO19105.1 MAG TPA: hypothetical protein [Caudoviricetes sp.]